MVVRSVDTDCCTDTVSVAYMYGNCSRAAALPRPAPLPPARTGVRKHAGGGEEAGAFVAYGRHRDEAVEQEQEDD